MDPEAPEGVEPDLEAPEPVEAPEAPPAEEEQFMVSRDQWEQTQRFMETTGPFIGALAQEIQQAQAAQAQAMQQQQWQQQQQQQPPVEWDPFEPESVQNFVRQEAAQAAAQASQAIIEEAFGPYQGVMEQMRTEQGESLTSEHLDRIAERAGPFNKDVAIMLSAPLIQGGTDPVTALEASAVFAQQFEQQVRQAERQRYQEEIEQLQGGPDNTSFAHGGADEMQKVPTGKGRYEAAVQRVLARRHPMNPIG